jgi:hypothetical protein
MEYIKKSENSRKFKAKVLFFIFLMRSIPLC